MAGPGGRVEQGTEQQPERLRRARLEMVAGVLPLKFWLNPSWALVEIVPFLGFFPAFGHVAPWRLVFAVAMHVTNSVLAAVLYLRYRRDPSDTKGWFTVFAAFQALVGVSWGLMAWLLWVPGNVLNNATVVLPLLAVLWSNAASKVTHWSLFLAAVLPIYVLTLVRLTLSATNASPGLAAVLTLTFGYTLILTVVAKRQTDSLLRTNLANRELTGELRTARDDALRKRYEAETANAAKTTFLANMSHELRTPLNAILGFSDIIASETFGPVGVLRYRDYANDIKASGRHLLSIINDILDIAKIESGKMKIEPDWLDVQSAIDDTLRVVAPRVREKGQHLSVRIEPDAHLAYADERAFKQILLNLASNAVKFTQLGGAITVHGVGATDSGFELIVEDNGPGIETSKIEHVFKPFNQVDNRYSRQQGGTGLGLSLVRGLAVLHGGRAWLETEIGSGVKAHVYFPAGNAALKSADNERLTA